MNIKEATQKWVNEFNSIPQSIIEKLMNSNADEIQEITPPGRGDHVYVYTGDYDGSYGYIEGLSEDDDVKYLIRLDGKDELIELDECDFEIQRDDYLPMWGTMWTFGEVFDNWWLESREGLQAMADCGFRVYEQEDLEYVFGIDGAGYDFYEEHWIPLYKARGLEWHDVEN